MDGEAFREEIELHRESPAGRTGELARDGGDLDGGAQRRGRVVAELRRQRGGGGGHRLGSRPVERHLS